MRIIPRLRWLALTPLLIIVVVAAVALNTANALQNAYERNQLAEHWVQEIFDLALLGYEYVARPGERPVRQWQQKYQDVRGTLLRGNTIIRSPALADLGARFAEMGAAFNQLVEFRSPPGRAAPSSRESEDHLVTALLVAQQRSFSLARQLQSDTDTDIRHHYQRLFASTASVLLVSAVVLVLLALSISRDVAGALRRLQSAVTAMAAGRLDQRIELTTRDEFGDLARAYNAMTESLSASYVSIARLESEAAQRRTVEAALRESEQRLVARAGELEASNRELEEFSYAISHDLRTPLRAIDGFARLLITEYEQRLDDEGRRLLHVVRTNTARLSQLIDDILAYTRIGRVTLTPVRVDMHALADSVWEELRPLAGTRQIAFMLQPLPPVEGDRALLRDALASLLHNAIKFSRSRDRTLIEMGAQPGATEHIYFIRDNGVGFDQRFAGKLFATFQRLHGPEEFEGTGIGLAIVKRIVNRHGGRVWAEGKVNEGATFYFSLPAPGADDHG